LPQEWKAQPEAALAGLPEAQPRALPPPLEALPRALEARPLPSVA